MSPEEYTERLLGLERRWAAEMSAEVARVAKVIAPLPVSEGWMRSLADESHPLTQAHRARLEELERAFYAPLLAELAEET